MKEKTYEAKIKKYLKENGCWYARIFANGYTRVGVPDILACVNGQFVAIEVKGDGGRISVLQEHSLEEIKKSGGVAIVSYPSDFETFQNLIKSLKNPITINGETT